MDKSLYEQDFHAWAIQTAEQLKIRGFCPSGYDQRDRGDRRFGQK